MLRFTVLVLLVFALWVGTVRTIDSVVFVNARIVTLDKANSIAQAMLIVDGRIEAIGSYDQVKPLITSKVRVVDMQLQTILPGFVDAHSHFPASGLKRVAVDLSSPPTGTVDSIAGLLARIENATKQTNERDWLLGFNYDNTLFSNGQHPTRQLLDAVAPNHAVYLWHHSGHMGVANSIALQRFDIDKNKHAPVGGVIEKDSVTGELTGLLQETAAPVLADIVGTFGWYRQFQVLTEARNTYLAAGVTTVQNGYAQRNMIWLLKLANVLGLVPQRVVVWPASTHAKQTSNAGGRPHRFNSPDTNGLSVASNVALKQKPKTVQFRRGAIKILVDGSPQGQTAYLSKPYKTHNNRPPGYRGFPLIPQAELNAVVMHYHSHGFQLALHGNGDEAIEKIIVAVSLAQRELPRADARHILVHAQTIREDQLRRLRAIDLHPSFFVSHTFYWGDWHRLTTLGADRAANISPAAWADVYGLRYTLHSDAPVTPINPLHLVWSASTRQTRSGYVLGPQQRISVERALRAITIDAAWQNHLDSWVGSLESGKRADFIVLDGDPLSVNDVRSISVRATYIDGVARYRRK